MAYTKTPSQDTHGIDRLDTTGDSFNTSISTLFPNTLKYVNCFIEAYRQTADKPKYRVRKREFYDVDNESYSTVNALDNFSTWSLACATNNNVVFARDARLYFIDTAANTITFAPTSEATMYQSSATTALDSTGTEKVYVLINGSKIVESSITGGASSVTAQLLSGALDPAAGLVYLNGYLFAADTSRGRIYNSDPQAGYTTWQTINWISPEIFTDGLQFIAKHHNHVVAVGNRSTEFFYDAQLETTSPLARQETYTQAIGCYPLLSAYSKRYAQIGDDIYFPGVVPNGGVSIYRIRDFKVDVVSNAYIDDRINYGLADGVYSQLKAIKVIQVLGKPHLMLVMTDDEHLCLNPESGNWWSFSEEDFDPSMMVGDMLAIAAQAISSCRFVYRGTESSTIYLGTGTKYQSGTVTATIISDIWDHGSNVMKHIKWVDAIGSYGNNAMTLGWYKEPSYQNIGSTFAMTTSTNQFNANRWRNLGKARRIALRLDVSGTDDISHEAFDIAFNSGTW